MAAGTRLARQGVTNVAVEYAACHLAADLDPVRVNAISPALRRGCVGSAGRWQGRPAEQERRGNAGRTARRADDVVDAAMWLLRAGVISGETVHLGGGARRKTS
jgi:enoyl-[acyl-carrier-protein] reductase (NADH)